MLIHQYLDHGACFLVRDWIPATVSTETIFRPEPVSIPSHGVFYIDTRSMYSFSPTYPVKDGTCSPVLTGILRSLGKQVSHPPFKNLSFCLTDSMKNPLRNLFNVPSSPQCPPRSL